MSEEQNQTTTPPEVDEKSRREMSVKLIRKDAQIGVDPKTNKPIYQEPLVGISVSRGDRYDHIHFDHEQTEIYLDVEAAKVAVEQSNGTLVVADDSRVNLKGEVAAAPEEPPATTSQRKRGSKQDDKAPQAQS